jgi:hypothetical protein
VQNAIKFAFEHVHRAMADAGYSTSDYALLVQNYDCR